MSLTNREILQWIWDRCVHAEGCIEWAGSVDDAGVPQMRVPGTRKVEPVRRVLLRAMGVDIAGKLATTTCGNPLCMHKSHAVAWTRAELQKRTAQHTHYGKSPVRRAAIAQKRRQTAILDMQKVREMRAAGLSSREAARMYGVTQSTAHKAIAGLTWKEYTNDPFAGLGARAANDSQRKRA